MALLAVTVPVDIALALYEERSLLLQAEAQTLAKVCAEQ